MNKGAIVKIAGFLVVPILLMLVITYLLYPMLNEDRYDLIVRTNGTLVDSVLLDSLARLDSLAAADSLETLERFKNGELVVTIEDTEWANKVDSLTRLVYVLNARLEGLEAAANIPKQEEEPQAQEDFTTTADLDDEAFKDRVKSLLNLEENEMAPILEKMTSQQLVRLYREAGNTQREKILRALNSDRAARLITEIML